MNFSDFRIRGKEAIDFVCDFSDTIAEKSVIPEVEPGYLASLIPKDAPKNPENFQDVLKDIQEKILPGVTQWHHPGFHAFFPTGKGYPGLIADIIGLGIGCLGHSWATSPAFSELESIVLDWLGKALSIPPHFLHSSRDSNGGGLTQSSSSDCILISMLAARSAAIKYLKETSNKPEAEDNVFLPQLVAYTSKEADGAVQKCAKIAMVKLRILEVDDQCSLRGPTLADAVHLDQENGLHPFFVSCTLGTNGSCGFDNLKEIGPIVKKLTQCWLHVDSSYAGSGFICPELRYLKEGMEFADSFNINCNKWLTVCYDCSCLWVKDRKKLSRSFITDPVYLQREEADSSMDDRNWGIQLSRRYRALKLWVTFRLCGLEGLQNYIRNHCKLAKEFEKSVLRDARFELCNDVKVGLVCFRLKGSDELNQDLLASINKEGKLMLNPAIVQGKYTIRFCVTHSNATQEHIDQAWSIIQKHTSEITEQERGEKGAKFGKEDIRKYAFSDAVPKELCERFRKNNLTYEIGPIYVPNNETEFFVNKSSNEAAEIYHDIK